MKIECGKYKNIVLLNKKYSFVLNRTIFLYFIARNGIEGRIFVAYNIKRIRELNQR